MEQVRYTRRDYGKDYRRERRRQRRRRRSSVLQRRYNFRGIEGAIVVVALMIGLGYISWLGLNYLHGFFAFLLEFNTYVSKSS